MSTTKFTTMSFPVSTLLGQIETGQIGLPELQRPFVWANTQVRDLFDSLYRGYPAGFFLLWQTTSDIGSVQIGTDSKQTDPALLVVDGQQRLTSLYAVFTGSEVFTEKFERVRIRIAFHPIREQFEVANVSTKSDPEWVDDITPLLSNPQGSFAFINEYLVKLEAEGELSAELRDRAAQNLQRLASLNSYPFTAIQLSFDLPIEEVAEIFVRVNSKGTQLGQADFILTLMSVHWDKGRKQLEDFCREAKVPSKAEANPFNWFIEPKPDQLLRVAIGLGHRRAQLKYAYELLRGKNLETGEVSASERVANFEKLKTAQEQVLDLTNFTEYLKALQEAGFRSNKMITSPNTIVYSYLVFLLGRCDYNIDYITLRRAVARWFMMCVLTSRYTGSAESQVEKDIRRFGEAKNAEQFLATIDQIIAANLTDSFWDLTLPESLAWSGGNIPAMFVYYASLNLLGAKVLFSNLTVHELLDPTVVAKKKPLERHHLFPKAYLATLGITKLANTNKVANYALLEWPDNASISAQSPAEYFPQMFADRVAPSEQAQVRFWHALPDDWENMEYEEFLVARQKLMAQVIRAGFEKLSSGTTPEIGLAVPDAPPSLDELLAQGEDMNVEFKSSMVHSYGTDVPPKVLIGAVIKTIAAFLNTDGGTLVIGVDDGGQILGIEPDLTAKNFDLDRFENFLSTTIINEIDHVAAAKCTIRFVDIDGKVVCLVDVEKSAKPVYANWDKGKNAFFARFHNTTRSLETKETVAYIADRFGVSA
ncbi:hypothetical protein IMCC26207_109664 [Actinobacteria bacterium IMCC26207]|nr:hypothetical protein IMCC26207_109664 [Actinobacteria bacterium IMCC26207]